MTLAGPWAEVPTAGVVVNEVEVGRGAYFASSIEGGGC